MGNVNASQWMDSAQGSRDCAPHCPLCGGGNSKVVAGDSRRDLRKCRDCGVSYVFPPVPRAAIANRFRDESHPHFDPERNRAEVLSRIAAYIQLQKSSGTILDVGCATGFFLATFFPSARWNKVGTELLESSARIAENRGLKVFRGDIWQTALEPESVDVISALETFYYFPEPQVELAEFRRVLKEQGLLVLEMPVATSRIFRLSRRAGRWMTGVSGTLFEESDHIYYHTRNSITWLLENNGFSVLDVVMLPPNQQNSWARQVVYRAYWHFSRAMAFLTTGRLFLGPRFLIAAEKRTSSNKFAGFSCL